ncbi:unnamed protein product [Medioppia subpectinata]|uniref:Uncharacterized protein n=1 Tax=Medioppia subpectinata TaxID=1979941 RepID=A0A7R9KMF4_9ACAR|nr:unnamed protein product [Medioppia subpectinata]CAG2105075.1 unnamed protein product [Medioppia subpectinata]
MQRIRDKSSAVFCPKDGSETRIAANSQEVHYIACNPHLKHKCRDLSAEELKPLTFKEDIHSVDYMREYPKYVVLKVVAHRLVEMFSDWRCPRGSIPDSISSCGNAMHPGW